jgi:hypothetical protein
LLSNSHTIHGVWSCQILYILYPQCSKKAALASKDGETVWVSQNQSLPHVLVTLDHIIIRKHFRTSLLLGPFPVFLCHQSARCDGRHWRERLVCTVRGRWHPSLRSRMQDAFAFLEISDLCGWSTLRWGVSVSERKTSGTVYCGRL